MCVNRSIISTSVYLTSANNVSLSQMQHTIVSLHGLHPFLSLSLFLSLSFFSHNLSPSISCSSQKLCHSLTPQSLIHICTNSLTHLHNQHTLFDPISMCAPFVHSTRKEVLLPICKFSSHFTPILFLHEFYHFSSNRIQHLLLFYSHISNSHSASQSFTLSLSLSLFVTI